MLWVVRTSLLAVMMLWVSTGNAFALCGGQTPTISGTSAADTISGTSGADIIDGLGGNDIISGLGGNDVICGSSGDDVLNGDTGYDTFVPGSGDDVIDGGTNGGILDYSSSPFSMTVSLHGVATGDGYDQMSSVQDVNGSLSQPNVITGNASANVIAGGAYTDVIVGEGGNDTIDSAAGGDTVRGGPGDDDMSLGDGTDTLSYSDVAGGTGVVVSLAVSSAQVTGGAGSDTIDGAERLVGSSYADELTGTSADNTITGAGGADLIDGSAGNDILSGGAGADEVTPGSGTDAVDGGNDVDLVDYGNSSASLVVDLVNEQATGDGTDTLDGIEDVAGSPQSDTITGSAEVNELSGAGGDDVVDGREGHDVLDGGDGTDTVSYASASSSIEVSLGVTVPGIGSAPDEVDAFENVTGSPYNDVLGGTESGSVLIGGTGADEVWGGAGADSVYGGGGDDEIRAAADDDALLGEDGDDTFWPGPGDDTVDGGASINEVNYEDSAASVSVDLETGISQGQASGTSIGTDAIEDVNRVVGSSYADTIDGTVTGDWLEGGGGDDVIRGFGSADTLTGSDGDDVLNGGSASDVLNGGGGYDTVTYADATAGVQVDLRRESSTSTAGLSRDSLAGFEKVIGSNFADTISGDGNSDLIEGRGGDDELTGRQGKDVLHGEGGDDALRLQDGWWDGAIASTCGDGDDVVVVDVADVVDPDCESTEIGEPDNQAPVASIESITELSGGDAQHALGNTVFLDAASSGSFRVRVSAQDDETGVAYVVFPTLGSNWSPSGSIDSSPPYEYTYAFSSPPAVGGFVAYAVDIYGNSTAVDLFVVDDTEPPSAGWLTYIDGAPSEPSVDVAFGAAIDPAGVVAYRLERRSALLSGGACGSWGAWSQVGSGPVSSPYTDAGVTPNSCNQYRLLATDGVGNSGVVATSSRIAMLSDCLFA